MEKSLIEDLNWRYATKIFDKNKKVSESDLDEITEAFRLSPSGYGLQPWKLIIVENKKTREELLPNSWNQAQIIDASHLIVLARIENPGDVLVDSYLDDMVSTSGATRENLKGYEDMMKGFLNSISIEDRNAWADRQVMIATGVLISFLASKEIDSCPIEGFDKVKYNEILGLEKLGLSSVLVLPIGYRSSEDKYSQRPKIRFEKEKLIMKI
ncbi:MAG: NAD(P)H-dependent oxidoreductase [Candidatus Gracilibacteria bacterium]|nr:NAD(P)H-dependent oxidoreductase [Candidatus Gracilibacteria bacterium]